MNGLKKIVDLRGGLPALRDELRRLVHVYESTPILL